MANPHGYEPIGGPSNPSPPAKPERTFPRAPMTSDDGMTAEFMQSLFRDGVIGYKEFRSWLASTFPSYAAVRDPGVDAWIDDIARSRQRRAEEDSEPEEDTPLPRGA